MTLDWHVAEAWRDTDAEDLFASLDRTFAVSGEQVAASSISDVLVVRADGTRYYVKRYYRGGKRIRRFVGRSRVQREWENLMFLESIGIPCAHPVAFGQERSFGLFRRGALVTVEVPDAFDLTVLAAEPEGPLTDRRWREAVFGQVADYLRLMHARRFIHNDLKPRNILVTREAEPRVTLIDCPSGTVYPFPDFHYRRVRELGFLDRDTRHFLTRGERLRFFLRYLGNRRLDAADRRLLRKAVELKD